MDWLLERDAFIESVCGAPFVHEKRALFQAVADTARRDRFADDYLTPLYRCDGDKLLDWIACTAMDPVTTLTKYLLVDGFYCSETGDLRQFILDALDALSEYALSKSLSVSAGCPKQKWVI